MRLLSSVLATPPRRFSLAIVTFVAYIIAFLLLSSQGGSAIGILVAVPVWVSALLFGARGGLISGLFAFPLNWILAIFVGMDVQEWLAEGGILGSAATVFVGVTIGYLKDVRHSLVIELAERTKAQAALHESEARLKGIVETASSGIIIIDQQGFVEDFNHGAEVLFGYHSSEVIGQNVKLLMPEPYTSEHDGYLDSYHKTGRKNVIGNEREVEGQKKDGSTFPMYISVNEVHLSNRTVFAGIAVDLSERVALEQQLRQSQKLRAIGQLSDGVAHEINTPLQYLGDNLRFIGKANTQILSDLSSHGPTEGGVADKVSETSGPPTVNAANDIDYLLSEIPSAVKQSLEGVQQIAKIVHAMQSFAPSDSRVRTSLDLNEIIRDTVTFAHHEWNPFAQLDMQLDPHLSPIIGIPAEINQVILALLLNAVWAIRDAFGDDAREKGGAINISTDGGEGQVEVRIQDNGSGIAQKIQARIFDPFFTTREIGSGTGQGLSMARSIIVEGNGGSIDFETTIGSGTTFIIRLPTKTQT